MSRQERPRILFVSPTAESTGPTTSLGLLLDRLVDGIHEAQALVSGKGAFLEALHARSVPYEQFAWPKAQPWTTRLSETHRLLRWFRKERFTLVYANEASGATRNVCLAAKLAGTPFVCHVRSMGWRHGWKHLGFLRAASAVVAVSNACASSVERHVRPGRLHVVHNGIAPPELPPDRREEQARIKSELGLDPSTRLIFNVGHLTPRKGQEYALEAMKIMLSEGADVHLCLAGAHDRDPDYVRAIEEEAARPPLAGHVTLLGFRSDVGRLLIGGDILLHTALLDPHPRSVLEGMAAALPVVAFSTDGVAETVVHGETGYLVAKENASGLASSVLRLIHEDQGERLGLAGRHRVEAEFSEVQTADRVATILRRVLDEVDASV